MLSSIFKLGGKNIQIEDDDNSTCIDCYKHSHTMWLLYSYIGVGLLFYLICGYAKT